MASTSASSSSPAPPSSSSSSSSCRKKKSEGASFIQDVRDHFDEFVHASMDEHKACFKNTLEKMFGAAKKVTGVSTPPPTPDDTPVESVLPLSSTTSQ